MGGSGKRRGGADTIRREAGLLNFACDKCQKRYSIADEKVRGKSVKIRCKHCQNVITVEGPSAPVEESTRLMSAMDVDRLREGAKKNGANGATAPAAAKNPWESESTRAVPPADPKAE